MTPSDPYPVLRMLQSHLEGRLRQGETRLWLTAEAAQSLREIVRMKPRPRPVTEMVAAPPAVAPAQIATVAPTSVVETGGAPPAGGIAHPQRLVLPEFQEAGEAASPAADLRPASAEAVPENLTMEEKEGRLAAVRERALEGQTARALGTLRDRMVFAAGSPMADIVLVGEAPGVEEERQGEPFVGPAGQLLTKILKVMGLDRSQVYITNLCKYRPAGERPPTVEEMAACLEFVREEIAIIRPRVIVALGGAAITGLLGMGIGVSARGKFYDFDGIPVMPTLDPAYLLAKEEEGPEIAKAEKAKLWQDMLMVMEKAGLPVSERQRSFFPSK